MTPQPSEGPLLPVRLHRTSIAIGRHRAVSFERTLRIPSDGGTYPLPPSLGSFPLEPLAHHRARALGPPGAPPLAWVSRTGGLEPGAARLHYGRVPPPRASTPELARRGEAALLARVVEGRRDPARREAARTAWAELVVRDYDRVRGRGRRRPG